MVAALTMPALIARHQEIETQTKLKKIYSTLSNAMLNAVEENGAVENWGLDGSITDDIEDEKDTNIGRNRVIDILSKYLKTVSTCKYSDNSCEIYQGKNYVNGVLDTLDTFSERIALADGSIINHIYINDPNCELNWGTTKQLEHVCGSLKVDLNGNKKPNIYGKDIFQFYITSSSIIPSGGANETDLLNSNFYKTCVGKIRLTGVGCTAWVIYNGNMDYLRCPDKLGWDKAKSCK